MNTVLLATSVNVKKEFIDIFNGKLYILVKKYEEKNDFTHFSIRVDNTEKDDILRVEFCSIFTIRENDKIENLKNDFYSLISNFEVTDLIMNRFKVYKEIEGINIINF